MQIIAYILAFIFFSVHLCSAQNLTTKGKRFWVGFMQNVGDPENPNQGVQLSVYISSNTATSGTVSIPAQGWSQNFNVAANNTVQVSIPTNFAQTNTVELTDKTGVLIVSNDSVNVFALNAQQYSTDASVVLPQNSLREEYIVTAYDEQFPTQYPSSVLIAATQDNTQIQITPSVTTTGGKPANVPFTITLNQGQTYQFQSESDLTGTRIKAVSQSCKAFAVFAGHRCTNIGDCPNCDHVFEQMFPINTLGREYIAVPARSREYDFVRVLATQNATTVNVSDGTTFTLNSGQYNTVPIQAINSLYIRANKPIMVTQYTRSACCDEINAEACGDNFGYRYGDPFMLLLSPVEQMIIKQATVNAFNYNQIDSSFINIATKTANKNLVTLDGTNIGNSFTAIPGNAIYSTTRMRVAKGNHIIRSDSGFVAFVYGFGERISYGYSADAVLNNIALRIKAEGSVNLANVCPGINIKLTGESTTAVQSWSWNFGDGNTATGQNTSHTYTSPGVYYVKLYAQREGVCGLDSTIQEITVKGPTINQTITNVSCAGGGNGSITLSASGGTSPYTYALNNDNYASNPTFNNLSAGSFTAKVRDNAGCISTKTLSVTQPQPLNVTLNRTNITCNGFDDGKITATVTGGTPPYTYLWSNGATTATLDSLLAGTYSLTVTDTKNCTKTANTDITEPAPPIFGSGDPCLEIMANNKTYLTQLFKLGQLPPFPMGENLPEQNACGAIPVCQQVYVQNESYIGQGTVEDISPDATCLQQGEKNSVWYTFTVQNNGNFGFLINSTQDYDFALYNITGKTCSDITNMDPVRCNYSSSFGPGNNTGLNFANPQPGNLSNSAGDAPIMPGLSVQTGQTYMLIVSNFSSEQTGYTLTFTGNATVFDNTKPAVVSAKNNAQKCSGKFGPGIVVTFSERVKCSSIQTADFQLTTPNGSIISINNVSCGPDSAVTSVTLNINEISNVSGIFKLRIVGNIVDLCNNVLTVPVNFDIKVNPPVTATAIDIVNPCPGGSTGSFKVEATGGEAPYTYSLNNGPFQSSNTFTGLGIGSYTVRVSSADTCTAIVTVTLTAAQNPVSVTLNQIRPVTCNGGSDGGVNINVSSGTPNYSYAWSNGAATEDINNVPTGTYSVTVTDAVGCKATFSAIVTEPTAIQISNIAKTDEGCAGTANGAINITVTGGTPGYTYLWSNNAITEDISNLTAGSYKVKITDSKDCSFESDAITLTSQPIPPAPTANGAAICGSASGSVSLTATSTTSGVTFLWYPTATSSTPLFTGNPYTTPVISQNTTYYVRARLGACLSEPTAVIVTVGGIINPQINGIKADTTVCAFSTPLTLTGSPTGGTFTGCGLSAQGVFSPTNCSGIIPLKYAGTQNGCAYEKTINVNVVSTFSATMTNLPAAVCINSASISMTGTPTGGTFNGAGVSGSSFAPAQAGAGVHIITYAGNFAGCNFSTSDTITVTAVPSPKISGITPDTTVCAFSNAIQLSGTPSGGNWSGCGVNSTGAFAPSNCASPLTITYSGTTGGCVYSTTVSVKVVTQFPATIGNLPTTACIGTEAITLSGTPTGGNFSGNGINGNIFSPTTAGIGTHNISYSGTLAGCIFTTNRNILVNANPIVTLTGLKADSTVCAFSTPVTLSATPTGGTWSGCGVSTNGIFAPTTCEGAITLTYSGAVGNCPYQKSLPLTVIKSYPATISPLPDSLCINSSPVSLSANPTGGTFSGAGVSGTTFNPATAGAGLRVISYNGTKAGCPFTAKDSIVVSNQNSATISGIVPDTTVCAFSSAIQLSGTPSGGTWSGCGVNANGAFAPTNCVSPVTLTYSGTRSGCNYSTSVKVNVVTQFTATVQGLPATACLATPALSITTTPAGGTLTGSGITNNNTFNPALAGVGTHIISYTGALAGCSFTTTRSITVNANPVVTLSGLKADSTVCAFSTPVTLSATPTGGSWAGCGVNSNGVFAPTTCSGAVSLTYSGSVGNCPYEKSLPLNVITSYPATVNALPDSVCVNAQTISLSGTPTGGSFGGPGVSGASFIPSTAGTGLKSITYNGTFAGCPFTAKDSIFVSNTQTVNLIGMQADTTVCALSNPIQLSATPSGGTFSGCGVSSNGVFAPAACNAGTNTITYSGTKAGCAYTRTINYTLAFEIPANLSQLPTALCINAEPITLSASPAGGTFSGPGVSGTTLNPQTAGAGVKTIFYNGIFAGCPFNASKSITISDLPNPKINGLISDTTVCAFSLPLQLTATPTGGTFSGCGVSSNGLFAPASCDGPITITYSGESNACAYTTSINVRVRQQFDATINPPASDEFCVTANPIVLSASPTGGTFGGPGISGNTFNPSVAGAGTHIINYVGNLSGCPYQGTRTFVVNASPTVTIQGLGADTTVCAFSPAIQLTGFPAGGTFSGCGVSLSGNYAPNSCVPGVYFITYSGNSGGCNYSGTTKVTVVQQVPATVSGLPQQICQTAAPITLTGIPAGGIFSGSGMNGNSFNPQTAGTGLKTISYTGTSFGCTYATNVTITVNANPTVNLSGLKADTTVCAFSNPLTLTASPTSGSWSGCGISNNGVFAPTTCNGAITLTYAGTQGGCDYSKSISVNVVQSFPATINNLPDSICVNANPITVSASPTGGIFSGAGTSGMVFNPIQAGAGVHIVTYSGSNAGCNYFATKIISVTAVPTVVLSGIGVDSTICRLSPPLVLSAQPAGGTFSGCGLSSNGIFTPANCIGNTPLTYSGTLGGCNYSKTINVNVVNSLNTSLTGLPTITCQSGNAVQLSGTPAGGLFSGPGVSGNVFNPALSGAGTFVITYSGLVGNCGYSATQLIQVSPNPIFNSTPTNPTCNLCTNGKITVTVFVGTAPLQYSLDGGAFQSSNSFSSLGGGTYAVTVRDANGCQATSLVTLTAPPPSCDPPTNITVSIIAPGIAAATWDPVLGAFQYLVRYRIAGSVTWTNTSTTSTTIQLSGLNSQAEYELQVRSVCFNGIDGGYSTPVNFVGIAQTVCASATNLKATNITAGSARINWTPAENVGLYNIQYRRADQTNWALVTSASNNVTISNLRPNTVYVVRIRSVCGNNTGLWSAPITFATISAKEGIILEEENATTNVVLYPNPARESFTVEFQHLNSDGALQVYTLTGTLIAEYDFLATDERRIIDVSQWAQGTYICKVITPQQTFIEKVVIVR